MIVVMKTIPIMVHMVIMMIVVILLIMVATNHVEHGDHGDHGDHDDCGDLVDHDDHGDEDDCNHDAEISPPIKKKSLIIAHEEMFIGLWTKVFQKYKRISGVSLLDNHWIFYALLPFLEVDQDDDICKQDHDIYANR